MTLCQGTRGGPDVQLGQAILECMAPDGGLYVPKDWPVAAPESLRPAFEAGDYPRFGARLLAPWLQGWLDEGKTRDLCAKAWGGGFCDLPNPAPLRQLDDDTWVLELFHGPTAAFKDFGLSLLRHLFDAALAERRAARATVVMATSGDTGAAAVAAFAGSERIDLAVLFPEGRVSATQRRQMACSGAANVRCLEVEGDFDDCQALAKGALRDGAGDGRALLGVNSVNLGRLLAQMVYYRWAAAQLPRGAAAPTFVVPSGNFGNALSCWMAARAGLPVASLVLACNANDGLMRLVREGTYPARESVRTHASAMDITVPSNLERLLFECAGRDAGRLREMLADYPSQPLRLSAAERQWLARGAPVFAAGSRSDEEILATMRQVAANCGGWQPDPHTAVAIGVAQSLQGQARAGPIVAVGTAHPGKFPEVSRAAGLPECGLPQAPPAGAERVDRLAADFDRFLQWLRA